MTTWNPADKSAAVTLSGGDLTASTSTDESGVRATANVTGKQHIEGTVGGSAVQVFGIIGSAQDYEDVGGFGVFCYADTGDIYVGGFGGSLVATLGAFAAGDEYVMEVDRAGNLAWFAKNGGNWNASGTANPATGVGGIGISGLPANIRAFWTGSSSGGGTSCTVNFGASAFTRTPSSGFTGPDAGGGAYSLTAAAGGLAETGVAANLVYARKAVAAGGGFALGGEDAGLVKAGSDAYALTAAAGSFFVTGQGASLLVARLLDDAGATFSLSGQNASLQTARRLSGAAAAFALSGQDAELNYAPAAAYGLTATAATFALAGPATALDYSGFLIWMPIGSEPASWSDLQATPAVWTPLSADPGGWS